MNDEIFDSHEELAELIRRKKQRKRILAFVLAIVMLLTFAIPISMMIPVQKSAPPETEDEFQPPVYSADAEI